jgi:hypothetical protein
MSWWPGWNSVQGAARWEDIFFWVGIAFLVLLAGSEIISKFYGWRKDELIAVAEGIRANRQREEDAQREQEAASARAEVRSAHDELERLKARSAPRVLSAQQLTTIAAKVTLFRGQQFEIVTYWRDDEPLNLANQIHSALVAGEWKLIQPDRGSVLLGGITRVLVNARPAADEKTQAAATALVSALNDEGITSLLERGETTSPNTTINITVGSKPQPL